MFDRYDVGILILISQQTSSLEAGKRDQKVLLFKLTFGCARLGNATLGSICELGK